MATKKIARGKGKSRPKKLPAARIPKGLRAPRARVAKVLDTMSGVAPALFAGDRDVVARPRDDRSLFDPERYAYSPVFDRLVDEELQRARAVWGPEHDQNSLHESYAVILEEVDEFWDEVKAKQSTPGRADRALKELVQIAAMCRRCAEDVLKVGFE